MYRDTRLPLIKSPPRDVLETFNVHSVLREIVPRGADSQNWLVHIDATMLAAGRATTSSVGSLSYAEQSGDTRIDEWRTAVLRRELWRPRPLDVLLKNLTHLHQHGAPVAAPLTPSTHDTENSSWSLWTFVTGTPPTPPESVWQMGELLAALHSASFSTPTTPPPALLLLAEKMGWPEASGLPRGDWFVHMDLHVNNALVSPSGLVAIDWVDGGGCSLEVDLALNAAYSATDVLQLFDADPREVAHEFVESYKAAAGPADTSLGLQIIGPVAQLAQRRAAMYGSSRANAFQFVADSFS